MKAPTRTILLLLALGGVGVFSAVWVVIWLIRGSYLTALVILGLTIWAFGFATYLALAGSGSMTPRAEWAATSTTIRPQQRVDVVFIVATSAVFLAAVLYLVFSSLQMLDYVPSGVMRGLALAGCTALALFGAPTLYQMFKHRSGSLLRLDPHGFDVWNGQWGKFVRGTWDEVEQVLDHPVKGRKPLHEVIVLVLSRNRSAMLVSDAITGNSDALRDWVRFYWRHPGHRDELTDGRALSRLDQQRFSDE